MSHPAEILKALMAERGLSFAQAAAELGVHRSNLKFWVWGWHRPRESVRPKLAECTGGRIPVDADWPVCGRPGTRTRDKLMEEQLRDYQSICEQADQEWWTPTDKIIVSHAMGLALKAIAPKHREDWKSVAAKLANIGLLETPNESSQIVSG